MIERSGERTPGFAGAGHRGGDGVAATIRGNARAAGARRGIPPRRGPTRFFPRAERDKVAKPGRERMVAP